MMIHRYLLGLTLTIGCGPAVSQPGNTESEPSSTGDVPADETFGETTVSADSSTSGAEASTSSSSDSTGPGSSDSSGTTGPMVCSSPHIDPDDLLSLTDAPIRGNPDGAITLVEWVDYIEPFSDSVETTLEELLAGELGPEIRLIVKQAPLAFNVNARPAARAALAAGRQDAFWEYHDALLAWDGDQDDPPLIQIAIDLGLDLEIFDQDMASAEIEAMIDADTALLESIYGGIATPSFVINGLMFQGAQPLENFENTLGPEGDAFLAIVAAGATRCEALEQRLAENLG